MNVRNTDSKVITLSVREEIYDTELHPAGEVMNYPLWS